MKHLLSNQNNLPMLINSFTIIPKELARKKNREESHNLQHNENHVFLLYLLRGFLQLKMSDFS